MTTRQDMPMVARESARKFILIWLGTVCSMVIGMIVLGGVTRLTESGLSMVDWRPVTGWLPPLSDAAWLAEFEKYRDFPEYQKVNKGMSLGEFKQIFAYEYAHRLLGRLIGLAYGVPLVWVLLKGWVRRDLQVRLIVLLFLGGSQGVVGWWMVKSGLIDRPDVSHYRLAVHLGLAMVIISALFWTWLTVFKRVEQKRSGRFNVAAVLFGAVMFQILSGALVAGLNAGMTYNTWPLMDGQFFPTHYWSYVPAVMAPLEHITAIQFNHRMGAYILLAGVVLLVWKAPNAMQKQWRSLILMSLLGQALLGVVTLLLVVPVSLGALHQLGAVFVLLSTVGYWHALVYGQDTRRAQGTVERTLGATMEISRTEEGA